jgi:NAD(P)-dependent dehydrogenase (short-subunit alcohol dehydrogenase family)
MAGRVEGKVAIVTGSTGGIGEGIAVRLAAEGAKAVVSGRRAAEGERVVDAIIAAGGTATFVQVDLAQPADCAGLIDAAVQTYGALDILVNNAALFPSTPLEQVTVQEWDQVFAVNTRGVFLCCQAAIPHLRRQGGGSVVNIGTTLVYRGMPERMAYIASKGALLAMTKTLARGLVADRIRVNWITVGWVASPGEVTLRNQTHGAGAQFLATRGAERPMGRLETPEDNAAGVLYLVSDEASHVTGCELNISGGTWI